MLIVTGGDTAFLPVFFYHIYMIFYFSGTGNTLWAAQKMAAATGDCLVNIAEAMLSNDKAYCSNQCLSYTFADDERIGFFFPVHGWRPPRLVLDFIDKLNINNAGNHYTYIVCTAGDTVGEAVSIMENRLLSIGIKVDSAISLIMPESYVGLPFMDVDTPAKEQCKKMEADTKLSRFISDVMERRCGVCDITIGRWPRINSRLIGSVFVNHIVTDRPFHVIADRCLHCGKCASVCPVADIHFDKGSEPTWLHNGKCLSCFACYHHCPTHAIEYGGRTKNKGQYYYNR